MSAVPWLVDPPGAVVKPAMVSWSSIRERIVGPEQHNIVGPCGGSSVSCQAKESIALFSIYCRFHPPPNGKKRNQTATGEALRHRTGAEG